MKHTLFICAILLAGAAMPASAGDIDYSEGVFIVNEDWYGHQNSTVNYLLPDAADGDYWHYRVIQAENPGMELGCTNQFGAIWDGRFYLIAKQDKDPGAKVTGGRITVADASTMKIICQKQLIDPSGAKCDGRSFVGVDSHKGYVSTSNGVWIFDLDRLEITRQVEGTENPKASNLYQGQCGTMVAAAERVFVAHQQYGLLVIDPSRDCVEATLSMDFVAEKAGIGSVVKSRDGMLWLSVAKDTQGLGTALPAIVRVDPVTLECETVDIPDGMFAPSNSWYAWTPDSFCASSVTNSLYWSGSSNSWFSGQEIFRYDIDRGEVSKIIDLKAGGDGWKLYGCSMRLHPDTDEIYMSLYRDFSSQEYVTRRYSADGILVKEYPMIANYWFPSIPVFPQTGAADGVTDAETVPSGGELTVATLGGIVVYRGDAAGFDSYRSGLAPGIYILHSSATTRKIVVR